jgi:hypothetical protein
MMKSAANTRAEPDHFLPGELKTDRISPFQAGQDLTLARWG